jgi:hypothetical protein
MNGFESTVTLVRSLLRWLTQVRPFRSGTSKGKASKVILMAFRQLLTLDMVFNPLPGLELLAVTYQDCEIVACNPWTLEQKNKRELHVLLGTLAATSDGRILAGTTQDGAVWLLLFETLEPVYHIGRPDEQMVARELVRCLAAGAVIACQQALADAVGLGWCFGILGTIMLCAGPLATCGPPEKGDGVEETKTRAIGG